MRFIPARSPSIVTRKTGNEYVLVPVANNIADMKKLLHKLKGSVKLYGARRLFETIKKFEDVLNMDDPAAFLKVQAEFDDTVFEITEELGMT